MTVYVALNADGVHARAGGLHRHGVDGGARGSGGDGRREETPQWRLGAAMGSRGGAAGLSAVSPRARRRQQRGGGLAAALGHAGSPASTTGPSLLSAVLGDTSWERYQDDDGHPWCYNVETGRWRWEN